MKTMLRHFSVLVLALSLAVSAASALPSVVRAQTPEGQVPERQVPERQVPERSWEAPHVPDQLLVKLPPGRGARALPPGMVVLREIPALGLALVQAPRGKNLAQTATRLTQEAAIEWAEPNYTISLDEAPNDPEYASQQQPYLSLIGAEAAWGYTKGRPETIIAVLDTGVDMAHEDLAEGIWTNQLEANGEAGADDDGNGFIDDLHGWDFAGDDNDPGDDHGHGTHVAGIAAARIDNGKGVAGLAGRATIMPVDVFQGGIGTYEALIRAIVYATDNGADVINMSLGASSYSKGEEAAVDYAYDHGVVVVAAAGNGGQEQYHYPAVHAHVIAVGSTTAGDFLSSFSNRGPWVDVAAPGSNIYSTFPQNDYQYNTGTSMAAPHVSGLAALILSRNPSLTPDQVRSLIESTAADLGDPGRDIYFGAGRIDAGRALAATPSSDDPPPVDPPGPGLALDLPGCTELITSGGFEEGATGWQFEGAVEIVATPEPVSAGEHSLRFAGGVSTRGVATQTVAIPAGSAAAFLRFDFRIEPQDYDRATAPEWPYDDWFTAEWRTANGKPMGQLLRTGNTADTVRAGLDWDHYIYRLEASELAALAGAGPIQLVFTAQNDPDEFPTTVWLDELSFCALPAAPHTRTFFSLILN